MMRASVQDAPLRGIALSLASTVLFASADTISKFLARSLPVIEIAWIRYVVFVGMAAWLACRPGSRNLWPRNVPLQVARGLCLVGSAVLFVFGLRQMAMAEAATISFISPLLITVLSIPLLGERVGLRRWAAVVAGLAGVVIVMRPGLAGFQPAALYGVASSACWALALVITRRMAGSERPPTILLWSAGSGLLVLTLLLPWQAVLPTPAQLGLALVLGVLASSGQWLVVLAFRHAPASLLAPFSYTQLLWSSFYGWLVFQALPDRWTLAGAAVIVASGLYTLHREGLNGQAIRRPAVQRP
ncbi:MAG TPA: DMT family transporter [Acetobacteraceae bacterium]|nr:DMT family transporter [Acetobacteraceae bacterium]